jgi:hypothetical protein
MSGVSQIPSDPKLVSLASGVDFDEWAELVARFPWEQPNLPTADQVRRRPLRRNFGTLGRMWEEHSRQAGVPLLNFVFRSDPQKDEHWSIKYEAMNQTATELLERRSQTIWGRLQRPPSSASRADLDSWQDEAEQIDAVLTAREPKTHLPIPTTHDLTGLSRGQMVRQTQGLWAQWRSLPKIDTTPSPLRLKAQSYEAEIAEYDAIPNNEVDPGYGDLT